jgi:hypothetical protein
MATLQPSLQRGSDRLATSSEVVLVQDSNSFFAYDPILKALQAATDIPLAHHILPSLAARAPEQQAGQKQDLMARIRLRMQGLGLEGLPDAVVGAAAVTRMEVPAYLAGGNACYDLTLLLDKSRMAQLPAAEQIRSVREAMYMWACAITGILKVGSTDMHMGQAWLRQGSKRAN